MGEVQQPLFRKRPKDRAAVRDLLPLEGKGTGLAPAGTRSVLVPTVLSRATETGEGQVVLWGRAEGSVPA